MSILDRVFRRRRIYDDLHEEIRAHLDEKTEALIAAGYTRAEAEREARRAFGNVTALQERGRETWQWPTIESLLMDVRFAMRQLGRAPAVAAIVVVTLALGVAATSTVFSWTRAVLLDPLPGAADASHVMMLESTTSSGSWTPVSWLDYRDFRKYLKSFDGLAAAYPMSLTLGDVERPERAPGELVSTNFFDVLRVRPALGHFFSSANGDVEGAQPLVIIGYGLWQRRWHGDSAVIGKVVEINRFPFTIAGVAPKAFRGSMPGEEVELWVPAAMVGQIMPTIGSMLHDRDWRTFRVLARVAPRYSAAAAGDEVRRFGTFMSTRNGGRSAGMSANLMPLWQSHWGIQDALRAPLLVLLGACGLVLLIVCANMATLLVARATGRRRELALRTALGAPRRRLVRQLLTEASLLAFTGSGLGLFGSLWLARSMHWLVPSFAAPTLLDPRVDGGVVLFTTVLASVVTFVAGIAPALHGSRERFRDTLRDGDRMSPGVYATRLRSLLVVAEMALAIVALVGAGLFYNSARRTRAVSPGFTTTGVGMASVSLTLAGYDSAAADDFLRRVSDRIAREPGITSVSYTDYVPLSLSSGSWEDLRIEGYAPQTTENMKVNRAAIGPGYFKTLNIALLSGRDFTFDDDSAHTPVMIVNEAFVRHFFAGRAAVGARVHGWGKWFTIVGVAKDVMQYRLTEPAKPYFYVAIRQVYRPEYGYTFLARGAAPVDQTVRAIARAVASVDATVPVYNAMPLFDYIGAPMRGAKVAVRMLALMAMVSLLLAAMGLYGVISYAVAQRAKEIGLRVALGARPVDVLRVVSVQAGALLAMGLIIGLATAAAVGRVIAALLYSVGSADVVIFAGSAAAMTLIAIAAVGVPARRAMNVDPAVVLRAD
ncbi:MAG TPA: ABC transporter permease [Gemmatimonadaceae bacterium]|nr:ABC transporter permease [Gemmatimonadaceae bacterium]